MHVCKAENRPKNPGGPPGVGALRFIEFFLLKTGDMGMELLPEFFLLRVGVSAGLSSEK